jgi:hypothetical protein
MGVSSRSWKKVAIVVAVAAVLLPLLGSLLVAFSGREMCTTCGARRNVVYIVWMPFRHGWEPTLSSRFVQGLGLSCEHPRFQQLSIEGLLGSGDWFPGHIAPVSRSDFKLVLSRIHDVSPKASMAILQVLGDPDHPRRAKVISLIDSYLRIGGGGLSASAPDSALSRIGWGLDATQDEELERTLRQWEEQGGSQKRPEGVLD